MSTLRLLSWRARLRWIRPWFAVAVGHTDGPDHELQPGEPTLDLLETCDGPGGPPWNHPLLDRLGAWWRRVLETDQ
jgi:hypothetical protein